ncbi:hypothetical protein NERG_00589 [Nematocida ausubeli]|uniref:Uncharacterized protein n=1 Tax=Nematocida ausubeli (strain ATCC PRA-371 / ERTm2) TaxID=1913371 RepID=H8ZAG8_NEMA1|nr:hypothetical protein NERG_00589 [Nematocida ausubeli]
MHSQCAHVSVPYTHTHTYILLCLLSGPFVHLFVPLTTLINITQFPLVDLFVCSCSLYIRTLSSFCSFLYLTTFSLISFILPIYSTENTLIF